MANYALAQIRYVRVRPSGQPAEDVCVNTLHFQASDGGLTSTDADDFRTAFSAFWATVKPNISDNWSVQEIRLYNVPATAGPMGAPAFTRTLTAATASGAGSAELPHQVACSVTLETDIRRRWGRIYLPGLINSTLSSGRFTQTFVDLVAGAMHTFSVAMVNGGNPLVIWHRASWTPQAVTKLRVDDVPDVIRRRRLSQKFYFHEYSALT